MAVFAHSVLSALHRAGKRHKFIGGRAGGGGSEGGQGRGSCGPTCTASIALPELSLLGPSF